MPPQDEPHASSTEADMAREAEAWAIQQSIMTRHYPKYSQSPAPQLAPQAQYGAGQNQYPQTPAPQFAPQAQYWAGQNQYPQTPAPQFAPQAQYWAGQDQAYPQTPVPQYAPQAQYWAGQDQAYPQTPAAQYAPQPPRILVSEVPAFPHASAAQYAPQPGFGGGQDPAFLQASAAQYAPQPQPQSLARQSLTSQNPATAPVGAPRSVTDTWRAYQSGHQPGSPFVSTSQLPARQMSSQPQAQQQSTSGRSSAAPDTTGVAATWARQQKGIPRGR